MIPALLSDGSAPALVRASIAPNTHRAYASALRRFDDWRDDRPETDEVIAEYVVSIYDSGRHVSVAAMAVAALNFRATINDVPSPVGRATKRVLAGFRRTGHRGRGQALGLDWDGADRAAAAAAADGTLAGLRDAAILAVMSDALLRISEAAAIDCDHLLDKGGLYIPRSKTDQEGEGDVLYLGAPTLQRVEAWRSAAGVNDGPLFRPMVGSGTAALQRRMSVRTIREMITRRCADAGLPGRTGHSARVGGAQSLARAGASVVEMQVAGRWKSDRMPAAYARQEMAGRGAVARYRYGGET